MTDDVLLSYERSFPCDVTEAFDEVLGLDLATLFDRRYAAIPAIKSVRDQTGPWGTPGQVRTIALADGGTMREELRAVDRPRQFSYAITTITGPMKPLVAAVDGLWAFEPAGTGARITWSWTLRPTRRLGRLSMPLFGRMWRGYARHGFDNIERRVVQ